MGEGLVYACNACAGRAATLRALRTRTTIAACDGLRAMARKADAPPSMLLCPSCAKGMVLADARHVGVERLADACPRCDLVWFPKGEIARLPMPVARGAARTTPAAAAPAVTVAASSEMPDAWPATRVLRTPERDHPSPFAPPPPAKFEDLPIWLGGPVELDPVRRTTKPYATWAILATMAFAFFFTCRWFTEEATSGSGLYGSRYSWLVLIFAWRLDDFAIRELAVQVVDPWRDGGVTLLTAFFAHASPWALVTFGFWFRVFADDVEALLGRAKFLVLVFGASALGFLVTATDRPRIDVCVYGACGGVAAVIGCYATMLPKVRLGFFGHRADPFLQVPAWSAPIGFSLAVGVLAVTGAHEARLAQLLVGTLVGIVVGVLEGRSRPAAKSAPDSA